MERDVDKQKPTKEEATQLLELWETNINLIAKSNRLEPTEKNVREK